MKYFYKFLLFLLINIQIQAQQKNIIIDAGQELGVIDLVLGTNNGPRSMNWEEDYSQLFDDLGFETIRTHDYYGPCDWYRIFPDGSKDPNDPDSYDFDDTDVIIRTLIDDGFDIMFRLGASWQDPLVQYDNDPPGTIRNANGDIIHTADSTDFVKFANICKHIVMHYNEGWADGFFYDIRKWEIWNEPAVRNHFWTGTPLQFLNMFVTVAKTLKSHDPDLLVGGPGLAGGFHPAYLNDLIGYCANHQTPLDFYTWHCYGGMEDQSPYDIVKKAESVRMILDNNGYAETLSICDEWNAGLDHSYFGDSGRGAAYFANVLTYFVDNNIPECYLYRGDNHPMGLFRPDGSLRRANETFKAWRMLAHRMKRIQSTGTDTLGFTAIASRSMAGDTIWVLLSNSPDETETVHVEIQKLPIRPQEGWHLTRWIINDFLSFQIVETDDIHSTDAIIIDRSMQPGSVMLLRFISKDMGTDVGLENNLIPKKIKLYQNVPNPFNPETKIRFYLPQSVHIKLTIFDSRGRTQKLLNGKYPVLPYSLTVS